MADSNENEQDAPFDFAEHRRTAVEEYLHVRPRYAELAAAVRDILLHALRARDITVNSVEARAKELESFGRKATIPSESNSNKPKYLDPMNDITDLAGVRVIAFFPKNLSEIGDCIRSEFEVIEYTNLITALHEAERFGYQSEHYLVKISGERSDLPEYRIYADLIAEIQVRTVLQHAWAEIEHDIQYKSSRTIPAEIRRKFMSLAGLLEIADREFQAIRDEYEDMTNWARESVEEGVLDQVEITAESLKVYLDKRVGPDARVSDFSYEWSARILRRLGFTTLDQVDQCIEGYDDDEVTRVRWNWHQGPVQRFEDMLLAGMGPLYVERRFNTAEVRDKLNQTIEKYKRNGIAVREYDPQAESKEESPE